MSNRRRIRNHTNSHPYDYDDDDDDNDHHDDDGHEEGEDGDEAGMSPPAPNTTGPTRILDLTNGQAEETLLLPEQGAEGEDVLHAVNGDEEEDEDEVGNDVDDEEEDGHDDEEDDDDDDEDDGGMMGDFSIGRLSTPSRSRGSGLDPSTPGRVVAPGQEQTGRWTKEEHEAFLSALKLYGKEWKKVAAKVKTRTVVQTRTHAQKYFQKLHKTMEATGKDDIDHVDMGVASTAKKPPQPKRQKRVTPVLASKLSRRTSSTTISAAQVISNLSSSPAIGSFVATGSSANMSGAGSTMMQQPARHGFSMDGEASYKSPFSSWMGGPSSIKITLPDPELAKKGFPEPSPAATGKRKLAEIAAARMLAGVAGASDPGCDSDGPPTPPPESNDDQCGQTTVVNLKEAPTLPLFGASTNKGLSLQIVNPESLGITYQEQHRRRRGAGGETSPVTPWDGQLEALVSERAKAEVVKGNEADTLTIEGEQEASSHDQDRAIHPVCGPSTGFGRSVIHQLVCEMNLRSLQEQLETAADDKQELLNRLDKAGYGPIHSACSISLQHADRVQIANEIVQVMLSAGADLSKEDEGGNTPLHWAARAANKELCVVLVMKNCLLDARNKKGETPLHWAMRIGRRGMDVVGVLLENGARPSILDNTFRRAIDVACEGFADEDGSIASLRQQGDGCKDLKRVMKESAGERRVVRGNLLFRSSASRTLVLQHPECLEHHPKSAYDWEAPGRISSILRRIIPSIDSSGVTESSGIFPHEVTVSKEFDRAKLDLLSRVHSTEYLNFVNNLSKDLEKQLKEAGGPMDESEHGFGSPPPVVPFTPLVQRSMIKVAEASVKLGVNSDTSFSAGSLRAARRAAGAVQHAVDCVLVGRNRNAFCVVRPPGHHAGINGLLEGGESCGFCIFNNVAAGALYAISEDRLICEKCAIVDIDVHHGNGTEEIVRRCNDPTKLFFFSIHLYDNDKKKRSANQFVYKFYPGTGAEDDLALNIINVPIVPLWKEASSAPTTKTHNTRHKTRNSQESQDDSSEARNSDVASETGSIDPPRTTTSPSSGRLAYRQAIQNRLLPALRAFNPDLILISAGFDAARGDVGNARHERGGRERMGLDLEPEDYAWTTRKILEIADICCQGRVVSVLEGGYGRTAQSGRVGADGQGLDRSIFAECAVRHLHAMIDPYDSECRFASS